MVKGLVTEISDRERVEVVLVKIRAYLLAWNWMGKLHKSPSKLGDRVTLFLGQLQRETLYHLVAEDFYSRIDHLYIQAIQWELGQARLEVAIGMIAECKGVVEKQVKKLVELLPLQDKKLYYILESKVEVLLTAYQLEVIARVHLSGGDPSDLAHQLYHKYQDIMHSTPVAVKVEENIQWAIDAN